MNTFKRFCIFVISILVSPLLTELTVRNGLQRSFNIADEKKQTEAYEGLKHSFGTPQLDNSKILLKIFSLSKEDPHSLLGPDKTKVRFQTPPFHYFPPIKSDIYINSINQTGSCRGTEKKACFAADFRSRYHPRRDSGSRIPL